MPQVFTNNASALLATSIVAGDNTVQVESTYGGRFPVLTVPGDYFLVTIEDINGNYEVCKCTSRTGDLLTITRGQEGTSAQNFQSGSRIELRITKGTLENLLQLSGGTMTGDVNMDGNSIENAVVSNPTIQSGVAVGTSLRGDINITSNELQVPGAGGDPTIGGEVIWHAGNFDPTNLSYVPAVQGMIMMWYGLSNAIPTGWALCDGNSGTPDLRDKFVVGAGGTIAPTHLSAAGGNSSVTSSNSGAQTTSEHVLTVDEIPAHSHNIWGQGGTGSGSNTNPFGAGNVNIAGDGLGIHGYFSKNAADIQLLEDTGGGLGHTHAVVDHNHTVSILPPYKGLYFIMKL